MIYLFAISTIVYTMLFIMWSTRDWPNFFVKITFIGLAMTNAFWMATLAGIK